MSFVFYNTATRKKETFKPNSSTVRIYSCGPTVYAAPHVGNLRAFIFADLLRRSLKWGGYQIEHAINITDIDDKTLQGVYQKKPNANLADLQAYTQPFIEEYFHALESLNIEKVEHYPRATQTVDAMIDLVEKLLQKKYAYIADGSVYFKVEAFPDYGKLSHLDLNGIVAGARVATDEYDKADVRDFALWKKTAQEENIYWEAPFGKGRPGWHLECSAMIHQFLKEPIDIHTGGVDLIFPHHENETAQSVCAYGKPLANYWIHCEHLLVENQKMSKSLGNVYTLADVQNRGFSSRALRYVLLSTHYRQKLNFTWDALQAAEKTLSRLDYAVKELKDFFKVMESSSNLEEAKKEILHALYDDLNISKALGIFWQNVKQINSHLPNATEKEKKAYAWFLQDTDKVFGLLPQNFNFEDKIPDNVIQLAEERKKAREEKNYHKADELRSKIENLGYKILDKPNGYEIQKK